MPLAASSRRVLLSFSLLAASLAAACGELKSLPTAPPFEPPPDSGATFRRVQQEIFTPSCALSGCHDDFRRESQLSLSAAQSYAAIVNVPSVELRLARIAPNDPERSYLYLKVKGGPGIVGDRMPLASPALTPAQQQLIRDWIRRGAPND